MGHKRSPLASLAASNLLFKSSSVVHIPAAQSPNATTQAPVKVARSTIAPARQSLTA